MNQRNHIWKVLTSGKRLFSENDLHKKDNRSVFDIDHDRIVYSNYFRRMHDKTQVFPYAPLSTTSQARSRLSHSLEVSCVGRSLGNIVGNFLSSQGVQVNPYEIGSIVATACLAHDIGNPPFGHAGEDAIQGWLSKNLGNFVNNDWEKSDLINFEGNAQGLRVLTRLEAWHRKGGIRPTIAMLGAFIKYPCSSLNANRSNKDVAYKKFGFFKADQEAFLTIFQELEINPYKENDYKFSRHPLSFLAEAADDICYAVIDLEDAYHLGLISFNTAREFLLPIAQKSNDFKDDILLDEELRIARLRSAAINSMLLQCAEVFKENINTIEDYNFHDSLICHSLSFDDYDNIKTFSFDNIYTTNRVLEIECAGFQAIGGLLKIFVNSVVSNNPCKEEEVYRKLIPVNFFKDYKDYSENPQDNLSINYVNKLSNYERILSVTDYISSMTDRYAIELYQRLSGIKLPVY